MPPSPQIIISLRQGSLRGVYSSDPATEALVVRWDNESAESASLTVSQGDDTIHAHVQRAEVQPLHHVIGSDIEAALAAAEAADPPGSCITPVAGLSNRERATVIAALRWWQESVVQDSTLPSRFPQLNGLNVLSLHEGNCLCNRLTPLAEPCECELPGPSWPGAPGLIAAVSDGQSATAAKVERCDASRRFATEEMAYQHLASLRRR